MTLSNGELSAKETQFVKRRERLIGELRKATWHFQIWKHLQKNRDPKSSYVRELNQAPAFFGLTIEAHLFAALMILNRLFDTDYRNLTIWEFLDFVERNLDVFSYQAFEKRMTTRIRDDTAVRADNEVTPAVVKEHRQRLEELPIRNLRRWRNKVLAHNDKIYALTGLQVQKKYPVMVPQIEQIIGALDEILNDCSGRYDNSTWVLELGGLEGGIQSVMDAIRFRILEGRKQRGL